MPQRIQLPDGTVWDAPDNMTDEQIVQAIKKTFAQTVDPATGLSTTAQQYRLPGHTDKPGVVEQFLGGAKHALDQMAYGVKDIFTDLSPAEKELLASGKAFVHDTGPASSIGHMAGMSVATLPVSGAIGVGGKVLSKALPAAKALASVGGQTFNLGLAGRAALEGAATSALTSDPDSDKMRDALYGAVIGGALPGVGAAVNIAPEAVARAVKNATTSYARGAPLVSPVYLKEALKFMSERTPPPPTALSNAIRQGALTNARLSSAGD